MKLDLIIVGNELLQGKTHESNGFWLASFLLSRKIKLTKMSIIADTIEEIQASVKLAMKNNDVVLLSGGLGPTRDDVTKWALGELFDKDIIKNQEVLKIVSEQYEKRGKDYKQAKARYEEFPIDFKPIKNPVGLAPGLFFETNEKKLVLAAPGVPREFKVMFEDEIYPLLEKNIEAKEQKRELFVIRTKGIGEEYIFHHLTPHLWTELSQFGSVSSLPQIMNVDIAVLLEGDIQEKKKQITELITTSALNEYVWHYGSEKLEEIILMHAKEKKITFGFAESCTGGLNASRITDISGSSASFIGSITSYDNKVKIKQLNVKEESLNKYGAVSKEVALEMAQGALKALEVDIVISTSGIAGPGGGTKEKPVGTIAIGFATSKGDSDAQVFHYHGDRLTLKERFSQAALFTLLKQIDTF